MNTCKCSFSGCKKEAAITLRNNIGNGKSKTHTCNEHAENWMKSLEIGQDSEPKEVFGITKSWYTRIG